MVRFVEWLPWTAPILYLCGALFAAAVPTAGWAAAAASTRAALAASVLGCVLACLGIGAPLGGPGAAAALLVGALIAFLGWVIGAYSRRYLRGEPGQARFAIALLFTLAAVSTVVVGADLATVIAAWAGSSFSLHHLLTFYRERPAAVIAAHKKFLASRLAEGLLITAALLLHRAWGTTDIRTIAALAGAAPLPAPAQAAAVLIAAAVLLKSAQLPLHGWLIQVMEAPTPVSALLHAGVVNLGGYVLLRLAPLIGAAPPAQALLVVAGSLTAAIAGLVMLTRISIKVRLAWSTCSQMGFMLMECGLGLYDLALLHLTAHALYKAYAFLTAGEAVRDALARRLVAGAANGAAARGPAWPLLALPCAWLVAAGSAALWHRLLGVPQVPWIATALLACGIATIFWSPARGQRPNWVRSLALIAAVQIYLGWHALLTRWLGLDERAPAALLAAWSLLVFLALYALQSRAWLRRTSVAQAGLHGWIYAGLYLDEHFTALTFRLWPVRLPPPRLHPVPSGGVARAGSPA